MPHDWLINVLNDLRVYALRNGLPALADQMVEARIVAAAEIASRSAGGDANAADVSDRMAGRAISRSF